MKKNGGNINGHELWIITWFKEIVSDTRENLINAKNRFTSTDSDRFASIAAKWMSSITGLAFTFFGAVSVMFSFLPRLHFLMKFGMWLIAIGAIFIIARNVIIPLTIAAAGLILMYLDIVDIFDLIVNSGIFWKIIIIVPYFAWVYYSISRRRMKQKG